MGDKFILRTEKLRECSHKAIVQRITPTPGLGAYMSFLSNKGENQVNIFKLNSFHSLSELDTENFFIPNPELRGYGFFPIAIMLASVVAKKHGIANISITPGSKGVGRHYESFGFMQQFGSGYGRMIFPLKSDNP
jgi:hypothetical protein